LMDITVKEDVDDLEAAKHISNFNVPIIFLTNNSSKKLMKQAKAIEPSGYLFKPIKEKELITTIEMTLYKNDMDRTIRESEERYRKLFETSTDALMMLDHSGFFDCNKATLKLFGLSNKEEFLDLHPSEISPRTQPNGESSRLAADRHINHAFRKGLNKFNWVHKRKNGEDFPAEVWLTAFRLNGKDVLQATVRDLTESRKAKEELQKAHDELENRIKERTAELTKSNEQLQKEINDRIKVETALQRKTHQQALLLKTARYINSSLDVNEVLKRIASEVMELLSSYGCTIYLLAEDGKTLFPQVVTDPVYEKEIMSTPLDIDSSFTGKAVKAKQSLMFNNAVANENGYQIPGTSEEEEERIIVAPFVSDGKVLGAMCLNRIGPYYTEEDLALAETFAHYATTALKNAQTFQELQHEIDERIQAEKAQMESEKRYEDLQSNIPVCIFRSTPQGKLISVNPAMIKMFGFNSEKDIKAVSTKDFYPNSDDREKLMKILLTEGLVSDFEVELYRKDKSILWCSLNIKTIHDEDGKWIYQDGIITDISERKQAEKTQSVLYNIANAVNSTKNLNDLFKRIHQELG
ncbi:MAG: PAS domain S-box protein, partial [Candidatus Cloacimonetes bacterium]|nr:PAS domain S-box protein [Candidatus Cloacimonadota bacterium]